MTARACCCSIALPNVSHPPSPISDNFTPASPRRRYFMGCLRPCPCPRRTILPSRTSRKVQRGTEDGEEALSVRGRVVGAEAHGRVVAEEDDLDPLRRPRALAAGGNVHQLHVSYVRARPALAAAEAVGEVGVEELAVDADHG